MRRWLPGPLTLLLALLVTVSAWASAVPEVVLTTGMVPSVVCNAYAGGTSNVTSGVVNMGPKCPALSFSRASAAWYFDATSVLQSAAIGVARFDHDLATGAPLGLLVEGDARKNVVLWDRDLTNAVWSASNVTAVHTETGIDGQVNSASRITASANNGTILQAITLASAAAFQTAFVKRITGSGAVYLTMDGGSTWTAIIVTSAWTRVSIPTQTLANPSVGFKLATNGDAIAVDIVQNENGAFQTSPIPTTSAAVTRAAEAATMATGGWFNKNQGTSFAELMWGGSVTAAFPILFVGSNVNNNLIGFQHNAAGGVVGTPWRAMTQSGGSGPITGALNVGSTPTALGREAFSWRPGIALAASNGSSVVSVASPLIPPDIGTLQFGKSGGYQGTSNFWLRQFRYYPRSLSGVQLQGLVR